jgi:transposase
MGKPYSDDLRERVVAAIEAGHSRVKVAELYNMALSTVGGFITPCGHCRGFREVGIALDSRVRW